MTTSADPVTSRWPAGSEFEESDITNTEGLCEVIEESTDMEMAWQTHTLIITSDTPHTSRKRPVAKTQRPMETTPMQSPAQKTPKLKSLVQRAPATKNYRDPRTIASTKTPRNSSGTLWEIWIGRLMTWRLDAWLPSTHKPQS